MLGGYLLPLPMHAGVDGVVDLHAVHAQVALAGFWVAGGYAGKGNEAAGVLRPALQDGEVQQGEIISFDDLFAGAGGDGFWKEFSGFGEEREHFQLVQEALRGFDVEEPFDAVGEFVEGTHFQG